VKINNGAGEVTVEGNIFYNQQGSDEHIDVNSATDVVIQDNIFFNDFAGDRLVCPRPQSLLERRRGHPLRRLGARQLHRRFKPYGR